MKIDAKALIFETLMEKSSKGSFSTDFYQREYKWCDSKDQTPIATLLDDIWSKFDESYRSSITKGMPIDEAKVIVGAFPQYYLGTVLINSPGEGIVNIVDGQQRLTTLTLLLLSLCSNIYIKDNRDDDYLRCLYVADDLGGGKRLYRMALEDRANILSKLAEDPDDNMIQEMLDTSSSVSDINLINAFVIVKEFVKQNVSDELVASAFACYIRKRLLFVMIEMPDAKDAAIVFEVTNDRGMRLHSYEILKGKLLASLPEGSNQKEIEKWTQAIKPLTTLGSGEDTEKADKADLFFSCYFLGRYADNTEVDRKKFGIGKYHQTVFKKDYFNRIQQKLEPDPDPTPATTAKVIRKLINEQFVYYSDFFRKIYSEAYKKTIDSDSSYLYLWLAKQRTQLDTFLEVMIASVNYRDPKEEEKICLVSRKLDKLYALWNLTGTYRNSDFSPASKIMASRILAKSNADLEEIAQICDDYILEKLQLETGKKNLTDVYDFVDLNKVSYGKNNNKFIRYFYARVDDYLCTVGKEHAFSGYRALLSSSFQIEHILGDLPQNRRRFKNKEEFQEQRDLIGGLGLIPEKLNKQLNYSLYRQKLDAYSKHGTLWLKTLDQEFYKKAKNFRDANETNEWGFDTNKGEPDKKYGLKSFGKKEIQIRAGILENLIPKIWK